MLVTRSKLAYDSLPTITLAALSGWCFLGAKPLRDVSTTQDYISSWCSSMQDLLFLATQC